MKWKTFNGFQFDKKTGFTLLLLMCLHDAFNIHSENKLSSDSIVKCHSEYSMKYIKIG